MDRLLKPQILNADPGDPFAYKHYKHWIKTFTSFADAVEQSLGCLPLNKMLMLRIELWIN